VPPIVSRIESFTSGRTVALDIVTSLMIIRFAGADQELMVSH
jgi:hypothetical protein